MNEFKDCCIYHGQLICVTQHGECWRIWFVDTGPPLMEKLTITDAKSEYFLSISLLFDRMK